MAGERNLDILLKTMKPVLNEGEYVFCSLPPDTTIPLQDIISYFKEKEGPSIVLLRAKADLLGLKYSFVASWIMLTIHSSLEAVGLTAAFSHALTEAQISCNVIAGYYHDHIFVDQKDRQPAMKILNSLSGS